MSIRSVGDSLFNNEIQEINGLPAWGDPEVIRLRKEAIAREVLAALIGKFAETKDAIHPGLVKCAAAYARALVSELDRERGG